MGVLHIVNRSPFESNALTSCLRLCLPGSAVLLIEDAVVAASAGNRFGAELANLPEGINAYVLVEDLRARGLEGSALEARILPIDYAGFVDLVAAHDSNLSWS